MADCIERTESATQRVVCGIKHTETASPDTPNAWYALPTAACRQRQQEALTDVLGLAELS
jgi:hypothetical protein